MKWQRHAAITKRGDDDEVFTAKDGTRWQVTGEDWDEETLTFTKVG